MKIIRDLPPGHYRFWVKEWDYHNRVKIKIILHDTRRQRRFQHVSTKVISRYFDYTLGSMSKGSTQITYETSFTDDYFES